MQTYKKSAYVLMHSTVDFNILLCESLLRCMRNACSDVARGLRQGHKITKGLFQDAIINTVEHRYSEN